MGTLHILNVGMIARIASILHTNFLAHHYNNNIQAIVC